MNMRNQSYNWQHNQSPPQPLMQVPTNSFPSSTSFFFFSTSSYTICFATMLRMSAIRAYCQVLVNAGAAISLIHETTLHNMKHKPIDTCSLKEVHIANGGFISLIGLVHLNVQLNHFNTGVNVYVTWDLVCSMLLSQVG
ncbi:unnamed protein product [Rotaria magnacalcarata]|uniref:Uncharacterized protein n=1 Tax=Rotaria magnacalcarata TaxID=392030 RepID=A0A816QH22_9BILA|nr:unnamed protein product [Rotaria magnacalcarata]CAF4186070.1 unnamed protein product [Rotaria magnacalcarata]